MEFNLADLFELVADTVPERTMVASGDVRRTYREVDERATRLAHHLVERGVEPGDRFAILSWNRPEWLEAMIGCFKARAVPVNVNYRYTPAELEYLLDNADAVALVHEDEFSPKVARIAPALPRLRHALVLDGSADGSGAAAGGPGTPVGAGTPDGATGDAAAPGLDHVGYEAALAASSADRASLPARSADDHYVLYTGGTTGMPKGVLWRQEDIFFGAMGGGGWGQTPIESPEELRSRINPAEGAEMRLLALGPLMHGGAQWTSFIAIFGGNTIVLDPEHHFDPERVLDIVERERVGSISFVGDVHARPLAEAVAAHPDRWDLSSVLALSSGGSILSKSVKEDLRARFPHALVLDAFGASETGANGAVMDHEGPAAGPRFTMNDQTTVLGDDLRPLTPGDGVIGRLARRGHIPLGYHKDEAKTAETFPVAPDGTRWVVPGDYATIEADGTITVLGRGSVSIQSGGEKIYPEEVEGAVKSHPDVFDVVVVGVPDDRFVERVAAIVQPRPGATPTLESIQEHCEDTLARYKLPRELRIVDQIPRTPVGKPDYRQAKALFA